MLTFKKSNFAFDDFIVSLGSGISNNDADNPTITTLYQRTADAQSGVTVNSSFYGTGENSFTGDRNNWLIDDFNTGFFVAKGSGDLKIRKGDQQTPNYDEIDPNAYHDNPIGTYTLGYIDHGNKPADAGYEYVIKPNATSSDMQAIKKKRPYLVLEKSADRHIVKHKEDKIWGYALFEPSTDIDSKKGFVKSNDAECLVMYQKMGNRRILLSMTNPDLGLEARSNQPAVTRNIQLTLRHNWTLSKPNSQVSKVSETDSTSTFIFTIEQAMPVEIDLVKAKKAVQAKKVEIKPSFIGFLHVDKTFTFEGVVTPAKATDIDLVWSSSDENVVTIDQDGVATGVFIGYATITLTDEVTGLSDSVYALVFPQWPYHLNDPAYANYGKSGMILYPNPTVSSLGVQLQKRINSYVIYDNIGRARLSDTNLGAKELTIEVDRLQKGIYILQVTDEKGEVQTEQFIKE